MAEPKYLTIHHLSQKDIRRIFSKIKVNPGTGCWEWTGLLNHNGYGKTSYKHRSETVHRLLYAWLVEPLPQGVAADIPNLDHQCSVRHCGNPAHLKLGPPKVNTMRSKNPTALNAQKTHCPQGHPYESREWKRGTTRVCIPCRNQRAKEHRQTPEGHEAFHQYHRQYRERPGVRERNRDAQRRCRERRRTQGEKA